MENHSSVTGWQELFSHTNPSKFRWLLQSLPLRYTAENLQVKKWKKIAFKFVIEKKPVWSPKNFNKTFYNKLDHFSREDGNRNLVNAEVHSWRYSCID